MTASDARRRLSFALLIAIVLGAALRLFRLDAASLWGDEACMLELAKLPALEIVDVLASPKRPDVDVAPPLYFFALRFFTLPLGISVLTARLLSAICGVLTIAAIHHLVSAHLDRRTADLTAALLAVSAFHVWYSQEARMYAMVTLLGVVATDLFLRFLKTGRGATAYFVVALAALYTQYYAYLLVFCHLALGLVLAIRGRSCAARPRSVLLLTSAIAIAVLPWIPVVVRDFHHAQSADMGFPSRFSLLTSVPFVLAKFAVFGNESYVLDHLPLYIVLAPVVAWFLARGSFAITRTFPAAPWLLLGYLFIPMALVVVAAALGANVYKSHPFILFSPFFYALMAHGISRARRLRGIIALALLLGANAYVLATLNYGRSYTKPKVAEAMAFVQGLVQPGDLLLKLPAKLHQQPVQTGELLSWRYYAVPEVELVELNGRDLPGVVERLETLTRDRSAFFLAIAQTQFTRELEPALVSASQRRFVLTHSAQFPSRIRDFSLAVYRFARSPSDPKSRGAETPPSSTLVEIP